MLRCQAGEEDAIEKLALRWHPRLLGHAYRTLHDADAARDAVQESWLAIVRGLGRLRDPARFRIWVHRVLRNKCASIDAPRALKLRFGERRIRVAYRVDGADHRQTFALDGLGDDPSFRELLRGSEVQTIHSLEATLELDEQLLCATAAAPLAPVFALFLGTFASNKVQGFALMKAAGAANWPPVIAYFLDSRWQWCFGLCPTYWPAKLYWELDRDGANAAWIFPVTVASLGLLVLWLLRRFDRAMRR